MANNVKKEYKNEDIAVVWQPHLCIHDKSCWKNLGKVFKPLKRPWVKMENASTEEIIAQVDKCPAGALSYYKLNEEMENQETTNEEKINVKVIPGGPLMVMGTCEVTLGDGSVEVRENRSTYCRCGLSANKPFCDGGHKGVDWEK